MIATLLFRIKAFLVTWWIAIAAAALTGAVGYIKGRIDGAQIASAAREKANVKAITTDSAAKEQAAEERIMDDRKVRAANEELIDVISKLPDGTPRAGRVAAACVRLRRQGTDTSLVPACSGHEGGAQATP